MPDISALQLVAFTHAPVGIVLSEHRIIRAHNIEFGRMFGYGPDGLVGQSFRVLYPSDGEFDRIRDIGLSFLSKGEQYSDERLMITNNGMPVWCRVRAQTLNINDPLARTILSFASLDGSKPSVDLTPREREVIVALTRGASSKEIARELGISHRTVEDVRARLRRKFGVHTTIELLRAVVGI